MELERRVGETDIQYHKRLVYGKLEDKTLGDVDYGELSKFLYGNRYSPDVARRMIYGSKKTLDALGGLDVVQDISDSPKDIDKKIYEFKKERQKMQDQRTALHNLILHIITS